MDFQDYAITHLSREFDFEGHLTLEQTEERMVAVVTKMLEDVYSSGYQDGYDQAEEDADA